MSYKCLYVVLLLLAAAYSTSALTTEEESAVLALLTSFPALASVSPPWSTNASSACDNPPFYGLECTNEPDKHILTLYDSNLPSLHRYFHDPFLASNYLLLASNPRNLFTLTLIYRRFSINGLTGTMPRNISGLLWLEELSIVDACLSDALPSFFETGNLTRLTITDAAQSICHPIKRASTSLPWSMPNGSKLKSLTVAMGTLVGNLENSCLRELTSLETLRLGGPLFSFPAPLEGTIPAGAMPRLKRLNLDQSRVQAFLLDTKYNWPDLERLSLVGTKNFVYDLSVLVKTSPKLKSIDITRSSAFLSTGFSSPMLHLTHFRADYTSYLSVGNWKNLPQLVHFSASHADFWGSFSESMGDLKNLTYLDLSYSQASGPIPDSIVHCPLQVLRLSHTSLEPWLPSLPGVMTSTLTELDLSGLQSGKYDPVSVPELLGHFTKLTTLRLSNLGLKGSLPPSMASLQALRILDISTNALDGQIVDIEGNETIIMDAHNNRFTGSIPPAIASRATSLELSGNLLSGIIDQGLLMTNKRLTTFSIAHNQFVGPLPPLHPNLTMQSFDASGNSFNGTVPTSYCAASSLLLQNNHLEDVRQVLQSPRCYPHLRQFQVGNNRLAVMLPELDKLETLTIFSAPTNRLIGGLPRLPASLIMFDVSHNAIEEHFFRRWFLSGTRQWEHMDLSDNPLIDILPGDINELIGPNLIFLSLANIPCNFGLESFGKVASSLRTLDLTGCDIASAFPSIIFPNLVSLKIGSNAFTSIDLTNFKFLSTLDMSNNLFNFDVSQFSAMPALSSINARGNQLYGSLALDNLLQLQSADFSDNRLSSTDLASIGALVTHAHLRSFNISQNAGIEPLTSFNKEKTGLARTLLSSPSILFNQSVTCYELTFGNKSGVSFVFDEGLFSYLQCDCNQAHFGAPPYSCLQCPSKADTTSCGAKEAVIARNSFVYPMEVDTERKAVDTESCLITTLQTLSQQSNCLGITLNAADFVEAPRGSILQLLDHQCQLGSDGRLCSHCMCKPSGQGKCYFPSGTTCKQCARVFPLAVSLPSAALLLLVIVFVLSAIMLIVLRGKRKQRLQSFAELPLWRRAFYRFMHLVSLGHVSILITFVQMLVALTEWDAYFRFNLLPLLNANGESLGIRCLFPLLSDPMWDLLSRLSVPFVAVTVVVLTVAIGSRVASFMANKKKRNISEVESSLLRPGKKTEVDVEYPAFALATSLSVSVVKFFYFGTAMSAHEYLFSVKSPNGTLYSQNQPWMKFSVAQNLIWVSIPSILIFDLIIPLLFIVICYRIRNRIKSLSVRIYYGSLFDSYRPTCFWWEIINILKKLSIALVLKALPTSDAVQSVLIVSILAVSLIVQQRLNPWVRTTENIVDGVGSLLLIAALLYTRNLHASHAAGAIWYLVALSSLFVIASVGIIAYEVFTGKTDYERRLEAVLVTLSDNHGVNDEDDLDATSKAESLDNRSTSSESEMASRGSQHITPIFDE